MSSSTWRGSILVLTARQVGKSTTASWAIAHAMMFTRELAQTISLDVEQAGFHYRGARSRHSRLANRKTSSRSTAD